MLSIQKKLNLVLLKALEPSSSEFIVKASGIQNRYVIEKESLLDPKRMKPMIQGKRLMTLCQFVQKLV